MNDLEEVRFWFHRGQEIFYQSDEVREASGAPERHSLIMHYFNHYYNEFDQKNALDTYVFSLSQHNSTDDDGRLSMWRGYGGQGNGAALVFNTRFFAANENSPLLVAKVRYGSAEERVADLLKRLNNWCGILRNADIPDDKLHLAGFSIFSLIKVFALVTKHRGFSEEQEWRIVYLPEYDRENVFSDCRDYIIGPRGVEPKLRFKVAPMPGGGWEAPGSTRSRSPRPRPTMSRDYSGRSWRGFLSTSSARYPLRCPIEPTGAGTIKTASLHSTFPFSVRHRSTQTALLEFLISGWSGC
jgi:hypothetical protein